MNNQSLTSMTVDSLAEVNIDTGSSLTKAKSTYADFARPLSAQLLHMLRLDKVYERADGNYLYYRKRDDQQHIAVLDLACGYGALILGHNHPEIVQEAMARLQNQTPIHAQMSVRSQTGLLAAALSDEIGEKTKKRYITTLANSGTEAVEAAIKHARMVYYQKIDRFFRRCEVSFSNIQAMFHKAGIAAEDPIELVGEKYPSFEAFKTAVLALNQQQLGRISPVFLAAEKSFHGKSLAALSLTHKEGFRAPFLRDHNATEFFRWEIDDIEHIFASHDFTLVLPHLCIDNQIELEQVSMTAIAGVFVEPILGEGGAQSTPTTILTALAEKAREKELPLIFDEIQSGFYRTGEFLASFRSGVTADYYLLGKALGGGVAKISALLIEESCYQASFGLIHTSTFAEDDFSSAIALKALAIARREQHRINTVAVQLKIRLLQLQRHFPSIICAVQGEGLMLALSFKDFLYSQSYGFQLLARSGYMGYLLAGYLLNNFNIRVATPLSTTAAIRIQPSAYITLSQIDKLITALESLCNVLDAEDLYKLIEFTLHKEHQRLRPLQRFCHGDVPMDEVLPDSQNVGFLTHHIDSASLKIADPSLTVLSDSAVEQLLVNMMPITEPIILGRQTIQNQHGNSISIVFAGLCFTSAMARAALQQGDCGALRELCHRGVTFLQERYSVTVVGLGQYTSILTNDGRSIPNSSIKITTGNSFTVYIGVQAVLSELKNRCSQPYVTFPTMGIIGAGGNISSTYAQVFARHAEKLRLWSGNSISGRRKTLRTASHIATQTFQYLLAGGHPRSPLEEVLQATQLMHRLRKQEFSAPQIWQALVEELAADNPINIAHSLDDMHGCHVVVVATNSSQAFLKPEHFDAGTLVYDISVPLNCTKELIENNKGIKVILGGVVGLPGKEKLLLRSFPLKSGRSYGCISDTMLLGFEKDQTSCSFGAIKPEQVDQMGRIGNKHGFLFAEPKVEVNF